MVAIDTGSLDSEGNIIMKKKFLVANIKKVKNKKLEPALGFDTAGKNKLEFIDYEDEFDY